MSAFTKISDIILKNKNTYGHADINKKNRKSLLKAKKEIENRLKNLNKEKL